MTKANCEEQMLGNLKRCWEVTDFQGCDFLQLVFDEKISIFEKFLQTLGKAKEKYGPSISHVKQIWAGVINSDEI